MTYSEEQSAIINAPATMKTCMRVLAGAGSGKSTTIASRAKALMDKYRISNKRIILVTFSNRASRDLRHKLKEITKLPFKNNPTVSTIHGMCLEILKQYEEEQLTVLSEWANLMIFRDAMTEHLGVEALPKNITTKAAGAIVKKISELYSKYDVSKHMSELDNTVFDNSFDFEDADKHLILQITYKDFYEIVNKANSHKAENNLLSFDDILYRAFELLKDNDKAKEKLQKQYPYVFVDEAQDNSALQWMFIYNVFNTGNTCVVGDLMQELYGFRYADSRYMSEENLFSAYDNVETYLLSTNYRSAHPIVKLGNILRDFGKSEIIQEPAEHTKKLPKLVSLKKVKNQVNEGLYIAERVNTLLKEGVEPQDIYVLTRTNRFITTNIEPVFIENKIPYVIHGSKTKRLTDKSEVLYIIHCLQFMVASPKAQVHIVKHMMTNIHGIGPATAIRLTKHMKGNVFGLVESGDAKGEMLVELIKLMSECSLEGLDRDKIGQYIDMFLDYSKFDLNERYVTELKQLFSNWSQIYMEETDRTFEQIIPEIQTSIDSVEESTKNAVRVSTIHSSKGLESSHVFACGFTYRTSQQAKGTLEELYAFYVQISRAVKSLLIVHSDIITYEGYEQKGYKSQWLIKLIRFLES